jgi:hypothetical protein
MVHTCNSSTWEAEQKDQKFKVTLVYIVRPCLMTVTTTKVLIRTAAYFFK